MGDSLSYLDNILQEVNIFETSLFKMFSAGLKGQPHVAPTANSL